VVLELEQLEQVRLLAGGGHDVEQAGLVGQQDAGGAGIQQRHAPVAQHGQQVDDVELVDEGVGQLHERRRQQGLPAGHLQPPSTSVELGDRVMQASCHAGGGAVGAGHAGRRGLPARAEGSKEGPSRDCTG